MHVPSYQIHNVLKVYSRQVSQNRLTDRSKAAGTRTSNDRINLSAGGKRQGIIDKVAADIVDKITTHGPQDAVQKEIVSQLEKELGHKLPFGSESRQDEFVYNTLDKENRKTTKRVSVKGGDLVMKRLEELAKAAVDRNMEGHTGGDNERHG